MTVVSRAVYALGLAASVIATPALAQTTTVTSPAGLFTNPTAASAAGPGVGYDSWFANNVRNNGAAGITSTYARNGNGSIEFQAPQGGAASSKADFEYYFSAGNEFLLSSLTGFSYDVMRDFSRDGATAAAAKYEPALRLYVNDGAGHSGYLVYEGIYNDVPTAPTDWTHVDVIGGTGDKFIWATGSLPDNFNTASPNYSRTAADWVALLPNLKVTALSVGVGSGWDGSAYGAVDNISYTVSGQAARTFNFEAAATGAVPEAATWAMMIAGFGVVGGALRRRRTAVAFG